MTRYICPHETPGGPQRCALCRHEVERLHDPTGVHHPEPYWKRAARAAEREAVPMPDEVRRQLEKLRRPPAPRPVEDGLL